MRPADAVAAAAEVGTQQAGDRLDQTAGQGVEFSAGGGGGVLGVGGGGRGGGGTPLDGWGGHARDRYAWGDARGEARGMVWGEAWGDAEVPGGGAALDDGYVCARRAGHGCGTGRGDGGCGQDGRYGAGRGGAHERGLRPGGRGPARGHDGACGTGGGGLLLRSLRGAGAEAQRTQGEQRDPSGGPERAVYGRGAHDGGGGAGPYARAPGGGPSAGRGGHGGHGPGHYEGRGAGGRLSVRRTSRRRGCGRSPPLARRTGAAAAGGRGTPVPLSAAEHGGGLPARHLGGGRHGGERRTQPAARTRALGAVRTLLYDGQARAPRGLRQLTRLGACGGRSPLHRPGASGTAARTLLDHGQTRALCGAARGFAARQRLCPLRPFTRRGAEHATVPGRRRPLYGPRAGGNGIAARSSCGAAQRLTRRQRLCGLRQFIRRVATGRTLLHDGQTRSPSRPAERFTGPQRPCALRQSIQRSPEHATTPLGRSPLHHLRAGRTVPAAPATRRSAHLPARRALLDNGQARIQRRTSPRRTRRRLRHLTRPGTVRAALATRQLTEQPAHRTASPAGLRCGQARTQLRARLGAVRATTPLGRSPLHRPRTEGTVPGTRRIAHRTLLDDRKARRARGSAHWFASSQRHCRLRKFA